MRLEPKSPRPSLHAAAGALCLLGCVLSGPALWSQDADGDLAGHFSEVIDVRVVNLEVVVTDRDGLRVTGLAPADFIITVDDAEVAIEYFTEVLGGAAVAQGDETGLSTVPALTPGGAVSTSYTGSTSGSATPAWRCAPGAASPICRGAPRSP